MEEERGVGDVERLIFPGDIQRVSLLNFDAIPEARGEASIRFIARPLHDGRIGVDSDGVDLTVELGTSTDDVFEQISPATSEIDESKPLPLFEEWIEHGIGGPISAEHRINET